VPIPSACVQGDDPEDHEFPERASVLENFVDHPSALSSKPMFADSTLGSQAVITGGIDFNNPI
jgi:hypothetical protein